MIKINLSAAAKKRVKDEYLTKVIDIKELKKELQKEIEKTTLAANKYMYYWFANGEIDKILTSEQAQFPLDFKFSEEELKELQSFFIDKYQKLQKNRAYWFGEITGIRVCPYCNINFAYKYGKKQTYQLDHFYNKNQYPWLAISFYNLVPCCGYCNQKKSNKDILIYPHRNRFNCRFSLSLQDAEFFYGNLDSFKIELKGEDAAEQQNIKVLALEERYQQHKDSAYEIVKKSLYYSDEYVAGLYADFGDTVFSSEEEIKRLVLGNFLYEEDFHQQPLAKLRHDIAKDLGII